MVDIPYNDLSPEALKGLIEHFVLREGTDYGQTEYSLEQKVERVMQQLERKQVKIVYDDQEGSCDIIRVP